MQTIGNDVLFSFSDSGRIGKKSCITIRESRGCYVDTFLELVKKVAYINFKNPNYVLLYRGQPVDFRRANGDNTISTLKPSIFREVADRQRNRHIERFELLDAAENELIVEFEKRKFPDLDRFKRQQILRWSIIQHYEICNTPLLDVTHSLRIAASFASDLAGSEAFLFVLGVPNLSGAITASAEAGLQIVRLSSVCPPSALRPHIQEGYLLGEYPELTGYERKQHYAHYEIDCGRRLIAKFRFNPSSFWTDSEFPRILNAALYPNRDDPLYEIAEQIKNRIGQIG